jgi:hypothetical protein
MKILYNDSIKHGKNSTLEIKLNQSSERNMINIPGCSERTNFKLECSYMVSGMMERGWGKVSFPKGTFCPKFTLNNKLINKDKYDRR